MFRMVRIMFGIFAPRDAHAHDGPSRRALQRRHFHVTPRLRILIDGLYYCIRSNRGWKLENLL